MRRPTAAAATFITASTLVLGGVPAAGAAVGHLVFLGGSGTSTHVAYPPAGCYEMPADSTFVRNLTNSPVELRSEPCGVDGAFEQVLPSEGAAIEPETVSYQVIW
ncbi:hypothetical protein DFP74_2776 [Nocardiopsis sp. Huas11]|uniref:hypothetical protein n=1 Tax=Nocardiopsis sp. Huas11 TaxID=2183912 RepID=UPI000EAFC84A|nr:hypothetical protein [Nocardiopsis sp. Huas11]RKS07120.1 hypothetical protein DFP74_2776 [Nocardiopsis sp. Huas11]